MSVATPSTVTLRRTAVGPFRVEEAGSNRLLPAAEALGRLPGDALERVPETIRAGVLALGASPEAVGRDAHGAIDGADNPA